MQNRAVPTQKLLIIMYRMQKKHIADQTTVTEPSDITRII